MNYHVHTADGRRLPPQSIEAINAAIVAGSLKPEGALAWAPGMPEWQPLATVLGIPPTLPGASSSPAPSPASASGGALGEVIPLKNGKALLGYYCAIFGLIPCLSWILGPIALTCGILGLKAVRRSPGLPGTVHAWIGIVLGGIETALVLLVLVAMVIGSAAGHR